jgi:hypothetical protein
MGNATLSPHGLPGTQNTWTKRPAGNDGTDFETPRSWQLDIIERHVSAAKVIDLGEGRILKVNMTFPLMSTNDIAALLERVSDAVEGGAK